MCMPPCLQPQATSTAMHMLAALHLQRRQRRLALGAKQQRCAAEGAAIAAAPCMHAPLLRCTLAMRTCGSNWVGLRLGSSWLVARTAACCAQQAYCFLAATCGKPQLANPLTQWPVAHHTSGVFTKSDPPGGVATTPLGVIPPRNCPGSNWTASCNVPNTGTSTCGAMGRHMHNSLLDYPPTRGVPPQPLQASCSWLASCPQSIICWSTTTWPSEDKQQRSAC